MIDNLLEGYATAADLAREAGVPYFSVYSLAVAGCFGPPIVAGRTRLYRRETALAFLRDRSAPAQSDGTAAEA
jgi:hypothetical protein